MITRMDVPTTRSDFLGLPLNLSRGEILRLALASRGHSLASIARDLGVSRVAVSGVVHGHWTSARILSHLAALLGVSVDAIRCQSLTPVSVARRDSAVNVGVSRSARHAPAVRRRPAA